MKIEFLDVVTLDDVVISSASREEIYSQKLPHRIVHVMVRNSRGEYLMQRRSATSSYLPLYWSTSVGGHVQSGESYQDAAHREMREEIGIDGKLTSVGKYLYQPDTGLIKHIQVFESIIENGFIPSKTEVAEIKFIDIESINLLMQKNIDIHPELLDIWQRYYLK